MSESRVKEEKVVTRSVAIALGIICIILIASLTGAIAIYTSMMKSMTNDKNSTISSLNLQIADQNSTISYLNSQVGSLQNNASNLTRIVNLDMSEIWLNVENVSLGAGGFANWTFYPYSSGVVRVAILTTSSNPWVSVYWQPPIGDGYIGIYNIIYYQLATPSNGYLLNPLNEPKGYWTADFPVVAYPPPSTAVDIKVGNNSTMEAMATVTIGYIY